MEIVLKIGGFAFGKMESKMKAFLANKINQIILKLLILFIPGIRDYELILFILEIAAQMLGDKLYEQIKSLVAKLLPGIIKRFKSGGVEFIFPQIIKEFQVNFSFQNLHFIVFEYEENFDVKEIIELVNSKFLVDGKTVNNIDEIFQTILKEISYGFLYNKNLPFISLHFNKNGLLYSVMDEYYKETLTGNILTFIDYYLKSYVNGGFFKEEFIFDWFKNKNTDKIIY